MKKFKDWVIGFGAAALLLYVGLQIFVAVSL